MGIERFVTYSFSDNSFTVAPQNDSSFNRQGQALEVGIPSAPFQMREALMVRPYYLGKETRFYDLKPNKPQQGFELDQNKYPMLCRLLCGV